VGAESEYSSSYHNDVVGIVALGWEIDSGGCYYRSVLSGEKSCLQETAAWDFPSSTLRENGLTSDLERMGAATTGWQLIQCVILSAGEVEILDDPPPWVTFGDRVPVGCRAATGG
jgi:hypothetical protein